MEIKASIILDSVNPAGVRLTTLKLVYPRFIHAQLMTHRVFSRNTSSSRAIPVERMIAAVAESDVSPISYGKNQKGMVASDEQADGVLVNEAWERARANAIESAKELARLGLHKQHVNRILEPFALVTCLVSGTDFDNFYNLRMAHDSQPEIQELAAQMNKAMRLCNTNIVEAQDWHIPFIRHTSSEESSLPLDKKIAVSIARCARVSYSIPGEENPSNVDSDVALAKRLISDNHLSPTEHVAMALGNREKMANFRGWIQYRMFLHAKN